MILLDTHIWHWWINQIPQKLTRKTIALIEAAESVFVSAISCFEMGWLVRHGRIELGIPFEDWLKQVAEAQVIEFIPVTPEIASLAVSLPEHHKDPQDRMIIATAMQYGTRLLSFDGQFSEYKEVKKLLISKNL